MPMPSRLPPTPARKVRADHLARANGAWRARVEGASWEQAAAAAGYSNAANCMRSVRRVYDALPPVDREHQRALWRDRLELLYRQAVVDVQEQRPGAIAAAVRIAQIAAKLDGLDAPTQIDVTNPTTREIEAWIDSVLAQSRPVLVEGDIFNPEGDDDIVEADVVDEAQ